jgi:DNA-binding NarL/FixJ family response regulator
VTPDAAEKARRKALGARFRNPLTTPEQRREISRRFACGEKQRVIAESMGLAEGTIKNYCYPRNPRVF